MGDGDEEGVSGSRGARKDAGAPGGLPISTAQVAGANASSSGGGAPPVVSGGVHESSMSRDDLLAKVRACARCDKRGCSWMCCTE